MPICSAIRFLARASRPVEQVASRLCPLSTLFAFLSRQACVQVSVLALVAILAGIPLSYFLARRRGGQQKD